jgi:hypothetical protein
VAALGSDSNRPVWCFVCGRSPQASEPQCICGSHRPDDGWSTAPPLPTRMEDVPAPVPPLSGEVELVTRVRTGDRAEVWRGIQAGAPVHVTLFAPPERPDSFDALNRRVAAVAHDGLAPVVDLGRMPDGRVAAVRPLANGQSLARYIDNGAGTASRALAVADEIGGALLAIQAAGVSTAGLDLADVIIADGPEPRRVVVYGDWVTGLSGEGGQRVLGVLLHRMLTRSLGQVPPEVRGLVQRLQVDTLSERYPDLGAAVVDLKATARVLAMTGSLSAPESLSQPPPPRRRTGLWLAFFAVGLGSVVLLSLAVGFLMASTSPLASTAAAVPRRSVVQTAAPGVTMPQDQTSASGGIVVVELPRAAEDLAPSQPARARAARTGAPARRASIEVDDGPVQVADAPPPPEPVLTAPVAAAATDSIPPAVPSAPDVTTGGAASVATGLGGSWTGQRLGRPLRLDLTFAEGGAVSGHSSVRVGAQGVEAEIVGTWEPAGDQVRVTLVETAGPRPLTLSGVLGRSGGGGQVAMGGRARGEWRVSR